VTSSAKVEIYPGETSTVEEILALADEFRRSAEALAGIRVKGKATATAPFRLLAIHAIELYLNAFLRSAGQPAPTIRGLQHNLAARLELIDTYGLVLRKRTRLHLATVSANREYLASRYDPDATTPSQLNQLQATLSEVRSKVLKRLQEPRPVVVARAPSTISNAGLALRA